MGREELSSLMTLLALYLPLFQQRSLAIPHIYLKDSWLRFGFCTEMLLLEVVGPVILGALDYYKLRHWAPGEGRKRESFQSHLVRKVLSGKNRLWLWWLEICASPSRLRLHWHPFRKRDANVARWNRQICGGFKYSPQHLH